MKSKIDVSLLQKCVLWPRSIEEVDHRYGWLTLDKLKDKIRRLDQVDDRTPSEDEYLTALKQTVSNFEQELEAMILKYNRRK